MRLTFVLRASLVAATALPLAILAFGVRHSTADDQSPCCFANPRYSGVCQVVPGEGESCSSILAYLNNQNSVGKSYCGNTTIRGGWSQVDCEQTTIATGTTLECTGL